MKISQITVVLAISFLAIFFGVDTLAVTPTATQPALVVSEELAPTYDKLNDLITNQRKLLVRMQTDLDSYPLLSKSTRQTLESDLSDLQTRLTLVEQNLNSPESDNQLQMAIDAHRELFSLNEKLTELKVEHRKSIENDIFKAYLKTHSDTLDKLGDLLNSFELEEEGINDIEERYEIVLEVEVDLRSEYLEVTWIRFEEKMTQLNEAIIEYLGTNQQ